MWMINPELMCSKHLNDEHREIHRYIGILKSKKHIEGYCNNNLIEISSLVNRHYDIVNEMSLRGFKHNTPLYENDMVDNIKHLTEAEKHFKINKELAKKILCEKCIDCYDNLFHVS